MAEDVEAPAKGIGEALTRKLGPLPVWMWGAAAVAIYLYLKKRNAASTTTGPTATTPSGTVGTTGGIGSSDMSGGGGSGGDTGTSGSTTAGQYSTNDAWGRAAVNYLVGVGIDPTAANSAITGFLASQNLTADQQGDVNLAIQSLGAPPTLPQPGNAPPPVTTTGDHTVYASNPPTGLSVTAKDYHSVSMVWNKATNATSYTVSWSAPGAPGGSVTVPATDTHAYINGLKPKITYTFKVQAVPAKSGDPSASVTATTPAAPAANTPAPPPASKPAAPPANPHAGQHWQNPQVATLVSGVSMAKWASEHPGNSLTVLEQLNPSLGPNVTNHPTQQIQTSAGRWVNN